MLQDLKKKSLGQAIKRAILWLIIFGVLLWFGGLDALKMVTGPKTLDVENLEAYVGEYVTVDVNFTLGIYCYTEPKSDPTSCEYIVTVFNEDSSDLYLFGLYLPKGEYEQFEEYFDDNIDDILDAFYYDEGYGDLPVYKATGTLMEMDSESKSFFKQTLQGDIGLSLDTANYYYLRTDRVGRSTPMVTMIIGIACLLCLVMAIFPIVKAATGGYQNGVKKFASQDGMLLAMEEWYPTGVTVGNMTFGPAFIVFQNGIKSEALSARDLVWAYQKTTTSNGSSSYSLMLGTTDGKLHTVVMKRKTVAEALDFINQNYQQVAMGYNGQNAGMFKTNPASLRDLAAQQRMGVAGATLSAPPPPGAYPTAPVQTPPAGTPPTTPPAGNVPPQDGGNQPPPTV